MTPTIINANCLDTLRDMPDNSVDAVITDPPYGLSNTSPDKVADTIVRWASGDREHVPTGKGFMGAAWDAFVPPPAVWDECYRVLKPGGHMAVFAGSRTQDLMGIAIRFAGFEIRDSLAWLTGSGFPKSLDVSKAIDKAAGAERRVVGTKLGKPGYSLADNVNEGRAAYGKFTDAASECAITAPATDEAKKWEGWGTALKPAHEPILLARKPLQGTVAANVTTWGTGAINIDACRINSKPRTTHKNGNCRTRNSGATFNEGHGVGDYPAASKRFPANVVLDEHAAHELDQQSGNRRSAGDYPSGAETSGNLFGNRKQGPLYSDGGGASRFFYVAKAPKRERPNVDGVQHPTVKPLTLCRWLVRLLTPPGGVVLDPFAGSGTTVEAAMLEGFHPIGIEAHEPYIALIQQRIDRAQDVLPIVS